MNDVVPDGRRLENNRDPPGQKSVYIPPGDPARESYRLATFRQFPRDIPIDPREFASNGFYYVGYRDRVKCFSCAQSSDSWVATDDVTDARWHQQDCEFFNGRDESNVPIGLLFPHTPLQQSLSGRLNSNKTLLLLRTRPCDNAQANKQLPVDVGRSSVAITSSEEGANNHQASVNVVVFQCLQPINPHMRSTEMRIQTFLDHSSTWPAHRIRATPTEIADAGMYYLGERDRVKCWYCNGGLQNWERDDLPWEEHAKWFPLCEFVLQQKGIDYVDRIVSNFPNLRRPALYNPSNMVATNRISRRINYYTSNSRSALSNSSSPVIIDPRKEIQKRDEKVEEQMKSSLVLEAQLMGFHDTLIKEALKRKFTENEKMFQSLEELVEGLLDLEASNKEQVYTVKLSNQNHKKESLVEEMHRLEESKRCKACGKEDACVVLIPCGHLACCVGCGEKVKKCPTCNEIVREKVRSYIS